MCGAQMKHLFWKLWWAGKGFEYKGIHLHWHLKWVRIRIRILPLNVVWIQKYLKRIENAAQKQPPHCGKCK